MATITNKGIDRDGLGGGGVDAADPAARDWAFDADFRPMTGSLYPGLDACQSRLARYPGGRL
jgi:hypothetical protein